MSPIERRSTVGQARSLGVTVAAIAVIGGSIAMFILLASDGGIEIRPGDDLYEAGDAEDLAELIAEDGSPLLLSDVSGRGQDRPLYIDHSGEDHEAGWQVVLAKAPEAAEDCFVTFVSEDDTYRDGCSGEEFPAGEGLESFPWVVDDEGTLLVDLNLDDEIDLPEPTEEDDEGADS